MGRGGRVMTFVVVFSRLVSFLTKLRFGVVVSF